MQLRQLVLASFVVITIAIGWSHAAPQQADADVVLRVRGMVCSFCVQGVEKKLLAVDGVRQVVVKLKMKSVYLWLHPKQTVKDTDLKTAIEAAGYNLDSITRRTATMPTPAPKVHPQPHPTPTVDEQPKNSAVKD